MTDATEMHRETYRQFKVGDRVTVNSSHYAVVGRVGIVTQSPLPIAQGFGWFDYGVIEAEFMSAEHGTVRHSTAASNFQHADRES